MCKGRMEGNKKSLQVWGNSKALRKERGWFGLRSQKLVFKRSKEWFPKDQIGLKGHLVIWGYWLTEVEQVFLDMSFQLVEC